MPGWHARIKTIEEAGNLQVLGIAPEQYGDRMRLFMQWQQMDFPVLMDPLNALGVTAVPITLLVDEQGIIRYRNPKPEDLTFFLATRYSTVRPSERQNALGEPIDLALQALQSNQLARLEEALTAYRAHLLQSPDDAEAHFQLGVLLRYRYDSENRQRGDFQAAVDSWATALALNPGQYIWRRRIQQFGPRLDKPYPFYDWMEKAAQDLKLRGEELPAVKIAPTLSELAQPSQERAKTSSPLPFPDPTNALPNDQELLKIEATLVPHTDRDRSSLRRLHLSLAPQGDAHWSSDAQEIEVWLLPTVGKPTPLASQTDTLPAEVESSQTPRQLEAEFPLPEGGSRLVAFYYLCREESAECLFLKQELALTQEKSQAE